MMNMVSPRVLRCGLVGLAALAGLAMAGSAFAAEEQPNIEHQSWSFSGLTGHFDKPQLRRGYMVYKQVCSACHSMRQMYYRNLSEPGGPEFAPSTVAGFAADAQVTDGPNDEGEMFTRPGKPADHFVSPYPNPKAAAAANGGATPPDLSLMAKARGIERAGPWFMEPFHWIADVATAYQEAGPDYIYAVLTGYADAPKDMTMAPGMNYNVAFPGHQIAMPQPLTDGSVTYDDGTPATLDNYAHDVAAFLMWTAEPTLEERKRMGLKVMVYLVILSVLLYLSKRALWRNVEH
jgi:cytochrome c1